MGSRDRRIVLLGKGGAGKSSTGNTIFGEEEVFEANNYPSSATKTCTTKSRIIDGREITLTDTPGFCNTKISVDELRPEIIKCIPECAAGVHAFLIVLKVGRFTDQEKDIVDKIQNIFSNEAFKCATLLFTHGYDLRGKSLQEFVKENDELHKLVQKCGGRCHVIDNEHWNQGQQDKNRSNQFQVSELLKTIDQMVDQNGGSCYTNEMLQAVEEEVQAVGKVKVITAATGGATGAAATGKVSAATWLSTAAKGSRERRIVLLGKTGAGKSSAGNTILGEEVFKADNSSNSFTMTCTSRSRIIDGRKISLIDTPGFFDTRIPEDELRPEIIKCITECAAGVHAFLIVLKVRRFTDQEKEIFDKIQKMFSNEAFKCATVLFTCGYDLKGETIQEFVKKNYDLHKLVQKCGGRCHVIDNEFWNQGQQDKNSINQVQVSELLKTIDQMVEQNGGGCYTNKILQAVQQKIQAAMMLIRKESGGKLSEDEIIRLAIAKVMFKLNVLLAGIATGDLLGVLFGIVGLGIQLFLSIMMLFYQLFT